MSEPSSGVLLPALNAARTLSGPSTTAKRAAKREEADQSAAVKSLCKTLQATTMKLLFSFVALQDESEASANGGASIALALAASKREELSAMITDTLAGNIEKVIQSKDVAMRSHVLRDLRARFQPPPEKPKPIMVDEAVQTVVKKPRVSLSTAAAAATRQQPAAESPPVRMAAPEAPAAASEAGPSDDDILKMLRGEGDGAAAQAADGSAGVASPTAASPADAAPSASTTVGAREVGRALTEHDTRVSSGNTRRERPVSAAASTGEHGATNTALPGIYERQMKWAAKAQEKREAARVEKENREKEAEKPKDKKESSRWAHVESVMAKQRKHAEEAWKSELREQMQAERERRERAELKAQEASESKVRLMMERDAAESKRLEAKAQMDKYHERMVKAEGKYAEARKAQETLEKQHADVLEIRDAFGEKGLELWPMFPGRKVHRVLDTDEFDGRVSQEFRVKDAETGERGVTLLMGRLAGGKTAEAQAVLFESKYMSDLDAARWFGRNAHRFEQTRERIAREKERAAQLSARRPMSRE